MKIRLKNLNQEDPKDLFEVGMLLEITAVNRTIGEITTDTDWSELAWINAIRSTHFYYSNQDHMTRLYQDGKISLEEYGRIMLSQKGLRPK